MRKLFLSVVSFVVGLTMMVSCLGSTDYTYYNDAAITSFTLGTLNCYYTVLASDGTDSIIKRTMDCSTCYFNIDQVNGEIWNTDSLPIDIDASKVLCTVVSRNSSSVGIKSMTSDTINAYSSTDSLDFTEPRLFYVYGSSGLSLRIYTVKVNVHEEVGDTCIWTQTLAGNDEFATLSDMKLVPCRDNMYLFGNDGDTRIFTTAINDGREWTEIVAVPALDEGASKNVVVKDDVFYTYSDGRILSSYDAEVWDEVADVSLGQLLGASTANLYALSADYRSILMSTDDGLSWMEEELDDDCQFLPTEDISFAMHPLTTNTHTDKLVFIGNRSLDAYPNDTSAVVWSKVDEYSSGSRSNKWNYVAFAEDNYTKRAPRAENWQIVNYDENNIKALSGNGKGESQAVGLDRVYHSGDDGITWFGDSVMTLPEGLSSSKTRFAFGADKVNSVWIVCGGTGEVWKGRINRVAWKKEQEYFVE